MSEEVKKDVLAVKLETAIENIKENVAQDTGVDYQLAILQELECVRCENKLIREDLENLNRIHSDRTTLLIQGMQAITDAITRRWWKRKRSTANGG